MDDTDAREAERALQLLLRASEEAARAHVSPDANSDASREASRDACADACAAALDGALAAFGAAGGWVERQGGEDAGRVVCSRRASPACLAAGAATPHAHEFVRVEAATGVAGTLPETLRAEGFGAAALVPLVAGGRPLGTLVLLAVSPRAWSADERRIVTAFAQLAADALARARERAARQRLELELLRARRLENVGHVAGGVAHDFNNMLTAMIGYMDLVSAGLPPGTEEQGYLAQALDAAEQAAELTRQMLAFARRQPEARTPQDLNALLERIAPLVRRLMPESVSLITHTRAGQAWVLADSGQVEQVLVGLALRARDAMPGGGAMTLSVIDVPGAHGEPDCVALEAVDNGESADADTLRRALGPPESSGDDGRELQLAVAAALVRLSGGRLEAERDAAGGTRVRALWPLTVPPGARSDPDGGAPGGRETVLFVEDDGAMRVVASAMLARLGYEVLTAGGAEEALRLLAERPGAAHLLIADLVLPGMSGRDLALRARESRPDLRVLLTSGYAVSPGATEVAGGLPFLPKPFTIEALARRVRETLDAPSSRAGGASG